MRQMTWYIPSSTGDFRLTRDGAEACNLQVVNPTRSELEALGRFLRVARSREWVGDAAGIDPVGTTNLTIGAPLFKAAPFLAKIKRGCEPSLTLLRSTDGKIVADYDDVTPECVSALLDEHGEPIACAPDDDEVPEPEPEDDEINPDDIKPQVDAAATVQAPRRGCPTPEMIAHVRSNEVLHAFSTPRQWSDWMREGWMLVRGGVTGLTYRVAHRHSAAAHDQRRIVWCVEAQEKVCLWDSRVPPAEEVLEIKLFLEHREPAVIFQRGGAEPRLRALVEPMLSSRQRRRGGIIAGPFGHAG